MSAVLNWCVIGDRQILLLGGSHFRQELFSEFTHSLLRVKQHVLVESVRTPREQSVIYPLFGGEASRINDLELDQQRTCRFLAFQVQHPYEHPFVHPDIQHPHTAHRKLRICCKSVVALD